MHPNSVFRRPQDPANFDKARQRGFGVLAVNALSPTNAAPLLSHIPFVLHSDEAKTPYLLAHLVRSNPIARALKSGPLPAVLTVTLGDCYISPDWYNKPDQVPTWNYRALELRGTLELRAQDELRDILAQTSAEFEARLAPKPIWTLDKMSEATLSALMKAIVPVRLSIESHDATEKLSQNKDQADKKSVVAALACLPEAPPVLSGAAQAIRQAMMALYHDD